MDEDEEIIDLMQRRIEVLESMVDIQCKLIRKYENEIDTLKAGKYCCLDSNCPNRVVQRIRRIEYRK